MLSLQIVGDATEGTALSVDKKYWGGEEGESVFRWFRVLYLKVFVSHLAKPQLVWISCSVVLHSKLEARVNRQMVQLT